MTIFSSTKPDAWPEEWERRFLQASAIRVNRMGLLFFLAIALFELGNMLFVLMYTDFSLDTQPSRVYFHLYALLFSAALLSLFLIRLFVRKEKYRAALNTQGSFAGVILCWGAVVTAYDQRVSDQMYAYLLIVISVAILAYLRPWFAVLIFSFAQVLLMVLIPVFRIPGTTSYGNYINSLAFCIMSLFICCYRFRIDRRQFYQQQLIEEKNRQLEETSQQLAFVADHDPLTGLCNRRCLGICLQKLIQKSQADPQFCIGLFMIDVDDFKDYNDVFGHVRGDECLRKIAKAMETACPDGSLFRYGGEEFLLILPSVSDEACRKTGEHLCQTVEAISIPAAGDGKVITISVGCSSGRAADEDDWDRLLRAADRALYQAKAQGKNRFFVSTAST